MKNAFLALALVLSLNARADVSEQVRAQHQELDNDPTTQTKDGLTKEERLKLFNHVLNHKVAALTPENIAKYDTPKQEIGYCYGRAMAVHLRARKMGLKPGSIKKLYIIGDLRQGEEPEWRFHVTTLVKGGDKKWYAIDPILGHPRPMIDWIRRVRSIWDKKPDPADLAKLYLVSPGTVMPDVRIYPYSKVEETGEIVTDLSFVPAGRPGFKAVKVEEETVYEMSVSAQEKYFLRAVESVDADQFNFEELKLTVMKKKEMGDGLEEIPVLYPYKGYFKDLLEELKKAPVNRNNERRLEIVPVGGGGAEGGVAPQGTEIHGTEIHKGKLYSPRLGRIDPRG